MQYQKITSGSTIIEFHNNWLGEETVVANGQVVSKKSSIWGVSHYFTVMEEGHQVRYILTSKVTPHMQVALDLIRNGVLAKDSVIVSYGSKPKKPQNTLKKSGLAKLNDYDLSGALEDFQKALDFDIKDPEIHFHMACAYSIQEKTKKGFESLKLSVENSLQDHEMILNHDMLAYLRMHEAFEEFLNSGFKEFDDSNMEEADEEDWIG